MWSMIMPLYRWTDWRSNDLTRISCHEHELTESEASTCRLLSGPYRLPGIQPGVAGAQFRGRHKVPGQVGQRGAGDAMEGTGDIMITSVTTANIAYM